MTGNEENGKEKGRMFLVEEGEGEQEEQGIKYLEESWKLLVQAHLRVLSDARSYATTIKD